MSMKIEMIVTRAAPIAGAVILMSASSPALSETIAEYEADSYLNYSVVGLRGLDGAPVSGDALDTGFLSDLEPNLTSYSLTDEDGNEVDPAGILEFDSDYSLSVAGRLLSDQYDVFLEAIDETSQYDRFTNVSGETLWAELVFDYALSAEAASNSATASAYARAFLGEYGVYGTAEISDADKAELTLSRGVDASSSGGVAEAMSGSYVFNVLFRPDDFIEFGHFYGANGGLEATIAPIPLPLGAPLLLGSLAILAAASRRRA